MTASDENAFRKIIENALQEASRVSTGSDPAKVYADAVLQITPLLSSFDLAELDAGRMTETVSRFQQALRELKHALGIAEDDEK